MTLDHHFDVAGTGFSCMDHIFTDGVLTATQPGGSAGNVLWALAKLGHAVAPVMRLGFDYHGGKIAADFARAGADTSFIERDGHVRTPAIAELLDTATGRHDFSFRNPLTGDGFPRYAPKLAHQLDTEDLGHLEHGRAAISSCRAFYADRLNTDILAAFYVAASHGAMIVFEPSDIGDAQMLQEALELVTVLKISADRVTLQDVLGLDVPVPVIIETRGADGLSVTAGGQTQAFPAIPAAAVVDTCGAGDMMTAGLVDWFLRQDIDLRLPRQGREPDVDRIGTEIAQIADGILAGQALAAANCAFAGARGYLAQMASRQEQMAMEA